MMISPKITDTSRRVTRWEAASGSGAASYCVGRGSPPPPPTLLFALSCGVSGSGMQIVNGNLSHGTTSSQKAKD